MTTFVMIMPTITYKCLRHVTKYLRFNHKQKLENLKIKKRKKGVYKILHWLFSKEEKCSLKLLEVE